MTATVESHSRADQLQAAIEQMLLHRPQVNRTELKRAVHTALLRWDGAQEEVWWKWVIETTRSVGVQSRVLDCKVTEAIELAREGAVLLIMPPGDEIRPIVIRGNTRRQVSVWKQGASDQVANRKLRSLLSQCTLADTVRCVVIDPHAEAYSHSAVAHSMKPLKRVLKLLRPEWSDIWLVILFAFVVGVLTLATPIAVESLVNTVAFGRFLQPVVVLAIILFAFLSFMAAVLGLQTYVVEIIQRRLFVRVAADLSYRLPRVEMSGMRGTDAPELVNRFFDIVAIQKVVAQLLLDGVSLVLSTSIGMLVLAFYHPFLLGFDVVLLASIAFIVFVLGRGAVQTAIVESKKKYATAAWLEEVARCPVTFHGPEARELASDQANTHIANYLVARREHFSILMRQIVFALVLQAVSSTLLLGLGGWLVIVGELSLGQLVAAELIVAVIVGGFAKLGKHLASYYDLLASADKLGALFDLDMESPQGMISLPLDDQAHLELNNLEFAGQSISLNMSAGDSLAFLTDGNDRSVGELMDAFYGLTTWGAGQILIDGVEPEDLRNDILRERVALVRGVELFSGTVDENIHLNRYQVNPAEVRHVMDQLGLADVVRDFPEGYQTRINGSGYPFSRTQQSLLMLARSLVRDPEILLIDGALDGLSDRELKTVLNCLKETGSERILIVSTGREHLARELGQICDVRSESESAGL
ncbi:MAG: ABC transporter ATP-binding protein [Planctomycetaceae bacterium]|nr:ABC transporter ATP-binding protein [Planctomycetaceae bacterium]